MGIFGSLGKSGRLGDSGEWENQEIGGNHCAWLKLRTSWIPGEPAKLGDSGDSEISGESGNPEDSEWEESLYVAKIENLL